MAVHTPVSEEAARAFLRLFPPEVTGGYLSHAGIREGVENSNFHLATDKGAFILTLCERRVAASDLPFFLSFAAHLHAKGLPAPEPVPLADGRLFAELEGRPACINRRLPGASSVPPNGAAPAPALARAMGRLLGSMHLAAADFRGERANDLGPERWPALLAEGRKLASAGGAGGASGKESNEALAGRAEAVLDAILPRWPEGLAEAAVHADLFPDNILSQAPEGASEGKSGGAPAITGVIDFFFSCRAPLAYDLAVCHLAWCHDAAGRPAPEQAKALISGYEEIRPLPELERAAWHLLSAGAGLRFFLTRWLDVALTPPASDVAVKDPLPMLCIAEHHAAAATAGRILGSGGEGGMEEGMEEGAAP